MVTDHELEPEADAAAAFEERVRWLGRPDRRRNEAIRVRVNLARMSRVGLRERLERTPSMSRSIPV